jgi:hypothetical protein
VDYTAHDDKTRLAAFDRVIALTKHRLGQLKSSPTPVGNPTEDLR